MNLVFIYGPPASGKLTVAKGLARLTVYKLFHNHLTVDLVTSIFPFGTEEATVLSAKFRLELFEAAAKAQTPGLIFTYVYAKGDDDAFVNQVVSSVEKYGGQVYFVQLTCGKESLRRRLKHQSRKGFSKIKKISTLNKLFSKYELFSKVPGHESLLIDTERLKPNEAAKKIAAFYRLS